MPSRLPLRRLGALLAATLVAVTPLNASAATKVTTSPVLATKGIDTYAPEQCEGPITWRLLVRNQSRAIRSLGANEVGIVFPIYTTGEYSNAIFARTICHTNYQSPSPAYLAAYAAAAQAQGLRVFERPVLDQTVLYKENHNFWHGNIAPKNPAIWFRNYWSTLRPYLVAAQASHVRAFAISGELTSMARSPEWPGIIAKARAIFHGQLVFTASWIVNGNLMRYAHTSLGVDAYRPLVGVSDDATPLTMLRAWNTNLASNPIPSINTVTIDETGIPAITNAYTFPADGQSSPLTGQRFDQQVQANWFTTACLFAREHDMPGLFFWGPSLQDHGGRLLTRVDARQTGNFQPETQVVIRECFLPSDPPLISSVAPATISGQHVVIVRGYNLAAVERVWVNGVGENVFSAPSAVQLVITVPSRIANGVVLIQTLGGYGRLFWGQSQ